MTPSVIGVSGTNHDALGGQTVTCHVDSGAEYGRALVSPGTPASGSPVLNIKISSPAVNNPQNVKFKIRYAPQTTGTAEVRLDDSRVSARVTARATGGNKGATSAKSVSFSVPRNANGTRQLFWTSTPPQPKAVTIWYPAMVPSWTRASGVSTTSVSIPTNYSLYASAEALGAKLQKEESVSSASAFLYVNVLDVVANNVASHKAHGNVTGGMAGVVADVYQTNGTVIDSYGINAGPDGTSTYTLDFDDFAGQTVNAYYYVTGSLRKKYVLDSTIDYTFDFTPVMGDVNGDNKIDQADVDLLNANLGCTIDTMQNDAGSFDFDAFDLNRDGVINATDVSIAQANLGALGDN